MTARRRSSSRPGAAAGHVKAAGDIRARLVRVDDGPLSLVIASTTAITDDSTSGADITIELHHARALEQLVSALLQLLADPRARRLLEEAR